MEIESINGWAVEMHGFEVVAVRGRQGGLDEGEQLIEAKTAFQEERCQGVDRWQCRRESECK